MGTSRLTRAAAWGGVAGPVAFVGAWAVGGVRLDGYDPVDDAISRLAAAGAATRPLMTAGFLGFAAGVGIFATSLRRVAPVAAVAAAVTAASTAAVAATPLDSGVDRWHAVAATIGYASLAAVPVSAARSMGGLGHRRLAAWAPVATAVSVVALAGTAVAPGANGLLQRIGLTAGDLWLVAAGAALARRPSGSG